MFTFEELTKRYAEQTHDELTLEDVVRYKALLDEYATTPLPIAHLDVASRCSMGFCLYASWGDSSVCSYNLWYALAACSPTAKAWEDRDAPRRGGRSPERVAMTKALSTELAEMLANEKSSQL